METAETIPRGGIFARFSEPTGTKFSPYASLPRELVAFVEQVGRVSFPVASKRELLKKLGGENSHVYLGDLVIEARTALMFMPASMFPLASVENLAEKLSDHYHQRVSAVRRRGLDGDEVAALAERFFASNPAVLEQAIQAIYNLGRLVESNGGRIEGIGGRFLEENRELIRSIAHAVQNRSAFLTPDSTGREQSAE